MIIKKNARIVLSIVVSATKINVFNVKREKFFTTKNASIFAQTNLY